MKKYGWIVCSVMLLLGACKPNAKETGFITAGKLRIYYERTGTGNPLLFLHAGFMDHSMWEKQVSFFEKQYSVITIDLPGSGASSGADTSILVADVIRICLDSLGIKNTSVVGLSIGASCATEFTLAYPSRVNKLVLASPGINGANEVVQIDSISMHAFVAGGAADSSRNKQKIAEVFAANWAVGPFRTVAGMDSSVRNFVYQKALWTLEHHEKDTWANFAKQPKAATVVARINSKLLLIYADKDLPLIKHVAEYLNHQVRGSGLLVFNNAAHMVNMELPDRFNHAIDSFLIK